MHRSSVGSEHTPNMSRRRFGFIAAAAAVGTVMNPRLEKEGYNKPWAAAVNVASAPSGMGSDSSAPC